MATCTTPTATTTCYGMVTGTLERQQFERTTCRHHGSRYENNNKKIFSLSLTPVLNPMQGYSSRDRKNFSTVFRVHPVLKGSIFRKILPFSLARLLRVRILFANCFFFYTISVLNPTARQLLKKSRPACEQQHTRGKK